MNSPTQRDLRGALERDEFEVHYQPILSTRTGELVAFEALLRWQRHGNLVPPDVFIPVAEETGLIIPIGRWAMRTACAAVSAWRRQFGARRSIGIAVNVAPCQWASATLVTDVERALRDTGLSPEALKLEITESSLIGDPKLARVLLERLKALGVGSSIDDFGTGYSSLQYLRDFPVDTLKVDRAFVAGLDSKVESLEITRAIVNLAHSLGRDVVAEGVETLAQYQHLRQLQCEYVQGYFFAHPMPQVDAERYLQSAASFARGQLVGHHVLTEGSPDLAQFDGGLCLAVRAGPAAGETVRVDAGEIIIGRSAEATLTIADGRLSRLHARVFRDSRATLLLADLGSRNGTYCNEQRVDRCPLSQGDKIRLGSSEIEVCLAAELSPPRPFDP